LNLINDIQKIILENENFTAKDLKEFIESKYNKSDKETLNIIKDLVKKTIIIEKKGNDNTQNSVLIFLKHYSNFDLWFLLIINLFTIFGFYIPNLAFFRYFFGFLFIFFVPGYCIINIIYTKDSDINKLLKSVIGVVLSICISGLSLYILNISIHYIDETYSFHLLLIFNIISTSILWIKRYKTFELNLRYYNSYKNTRYIFKYVLLPIFLIFCLGILYRIYINYYSQYFNIMLPYFSWASDQWVHYAFVRDAIEHSYFDTSYMYLYKFYYPIFYLSLMGSYYITGLSLLSLFRLIPIFFGSCIIISLMLLAKMITKSWKNALITGLFLTIASPVFLSSTSVIWPQLIGDFIVSILIISFIRIYNDYSIKNVSIFVFLFLFLCVSHIVSIIVGAIIIMTGFILLSFKKGFNLKIFITLIPCYIFTILWTYNFNISDVQFGITSIFDLIKYGILGLIGIFVTFIFTYYISKMIKDEKPILKFEIGWLGYILFGIIVLILFNPWFWYYFPLTHDMVNFIPFEFFATLLITIAYSLTFGIIGFVMGFRINKLEYIILLGWILGISLITAFFALQGTYEQPSRTIIFCFEPLTIYSSFYLITLIKGKKKRRWKLGFFFISIIILSPLNLYSFTATSIGSGTINFKSEVYGAQWYGTYNNWTENTLYIVGTRGMYLNIGLFWDRNHSFVYIQDLNYLKPSYFNSIRNDTNRLYIGFNTVFMTNYFVHNWYFYTFFKSKIKKLYITPDLEQGWVNSSSTPYIKMYCNQYSEIYFIPFVNITQ